MCVLKGSAWLRPAVICVTVRTFDLNNLCSAYATKIRNVQCNRITFQGPQQLLFLLNGQNVLMKINKLTPNGGFFLWRQIQYNNIYFRFCSKASILKTGPRFRSV